MWHALASNQTHDRGEKKEAHYLIDLTINPKRESIKYVYAIVCFVGQFCIVSPSFGEDEKNKRREEGEREKIDE